MKINLAVYTAQEGYSWQPGTAIPAEQLKEFKSCIGKFPSPDAADFPFGGVFLRDELVVFYRYHVARKIDFRGRDALYCVLGVVPKSKAAEVDPKVLFALPEFAAPVQPFPTEAELPTSYLSHAPDWLKNLDDHSLDVRIFGPIDNLNYEIEQELTKKPEPPKPTVSASKPTVTSMPSSEVKPAVNKSAPKDHQDVRKESHEISPKKPTPCYKNVFVILIGIVTVFFITAIFALVLMISSCVRSYGDEEGKLDRHDQETNTAGVFHQSNITSMATAKGKTSHNTAPKAK